MPISRRRLAQAPVEPVGTPLASIPPTPMPPPDEVTIVPVRPTYDYNMSQIVREAMRPRPMQGFFSERSHREILHDAIGGREPAPTLGQPRYRMMVAGAPDGEFLPEPIFDTPQAATAYIKAQKGSGPALRMVREYTSAEISEARVREQDQFNNGRYKKLPDWFMEKYSKPDQFLHWSRQRAEEGYLAYCPTVEHLASNKQVVLMASSYLAREFNLPGDEISTISARLIAERNPVEFHITRDPGIVTKAYVGKEHCGESSSYPSCMRYDHDEFGLPADKHPVQAYVGPTSTLSLAYLQGKEDGDIKARAVVSEKSKTFIKVYGYDEPIRQVLLHKLAEQGYKRVDNFVGERIHIEKHPRRSNYAIIPYIDGNAVSCTPDGLICNSQEGAIICDTTAGMAEIQVLQACACCAKEMRRSSMVMFSRKYYCPECAEKTLYYCTYTDKYYSLEKNPPILVHNSSYRLGSTSRWCPAAARNKAFRCEHTGELYANVAFTKIQVATLTGVQMWCREANGFEVKYEGTGRNRTYYDLDMWAAHTNTPRIRPPQVGDIMRMNSGVNGSYCQPALREGSLVEILEPCMSFGSRVDAASARCVGFNANKNNLYNRLDYDYIELKDMELVTKAEDRQDHAPFAVGDKVYIMPVTDYDPDYLERNIPTGAMAEIIALREPGDTPASKATIELRSVYRPDTREPRRTDWVKPHVIRKWIWS